MNRRDFIRLSSYSSAMLAVPFLAGCRYLPANAGFAHPAFLMRIWDKKEIIQTGKLYRMLVPDESEKGRLESLIGLDIAVHAAGSAAGLEVALAQKTSDDFANGRTAVVDGWVLSRTEARQCALFAVSEE